MRGNLVNGTVLSICVPGTLMFSAPVLAQTTTAQLSQSDAQSPDVEQQAATAADTSQTDQGITDIVVTASRRPENVQRSALSIQALGDEQLERAGVTRPEDLNAIAPGVSIGTGGNYPQTYIRGVGNYATNTYAEGAVAYNLDGVYISRGWATRGNFFDLERVEILKGPQGTLYGRNASGGAINIITARPKLGVTTGFIEGEAGAYDLLRGTAALNIPIAESVALRASGQIVHRDGYLSDGYDDEKSQSGRVHLLFEPNKDFSLLLTGSYNHLGGNGGGAVLNPALPGSHWRGNADPKVTAVLRADPILGPLIVVPNTDGYVDMDVWSASAELTWNFGPATLTVLPAYRSGTYRDRTYVPGFEVNDKENEEQTSLEARLSSQSDSLKWVVGGYFFDEDQSNPGGEDLLLVLQGVNAQRTGYFDSNIRSYAAFGQATFSITDALRWTAGLRRTYERKKQSGTTFSYTFPNAAPPAVCPGGFNFDLGTPSPPLFCRLDVPLVGTLTYKNWTWKAGFEADLAPRSMLYGNVSTGFKSGGFFAAPEPNTFKPEKLLAFDLGLKNRFFDNQLQLNVEAFYWKYRDHQESHLGPTSVPGFFTFLTENAGRAKSYGADVDVLFRPTSRDQLSAKIQYNKSKYNSFEYTWVTSAFGPPNTGCSVGTIDSGGNQTIDCAGKQLVRSPTWTGTVGYDHTFLFAGGSELIAGVRSQFASSSHLSIDFIPNTKQDAYATFDADLTWESANKRLSVAGYVRNITEKSVLTQAFLFPFSTPFNPAADPGGVVFASIRAPRTAGVRVRYGF